MGLAKNRPTKKRKFECCTFGSVLTSVVVPDWPNGAFMIDPLLNTGANGIDFMYMQETRQLTCHVHFSQIPVNAAADATSRLSVAEVEEIESDKV